MQRTKGRPWRLLGLMVAVMTVWAGLTPGWADDANGSAARGTAEAPHRDPAAGPWVIQAGQDGFSTSGTWTADASGEGLLCDDPAGWASWTFTHLSPGYRYRVWARWPGGEGQADDASYSITDHINDETTRPLGRGPLDQRRLPEGLEADGYAWAPLGSEVLVRGTRLDVTLHAGSDGTTRAGAVRLERIGTWVPPLGVPAPAFGIDQSHWMYAAPGHSYDFGAGPVPYPLGPVGPYTHYVDNTHAAATDLGNPFGTPDRPRMTVPQDLPAGSVVEIHGGPYTYGPRSGDSHFTTFMASGTAERPVFFRGASRSNRPRYVNMQLRVRGQYLIVENLHLATGGARVRCFEEPRHVGLRNLEVTGFRPPRFGTAVYLGSQDIVLYNSHIHQNGDWQSEEQDDVHATSVHGSRIWIVDNHTHHNGGDSFQVNATGATANHIYVARNTMHHDRENAIDIKGSRDIIVSQNIMYGYRPVSSSDGAAIVGGHEGSQRTWLLFNEVYNSAIGIRVNDPRYRTEAYIIGNRIHDISGNAIIVWFDNVVHVVNNTIYKVGNGFMDGNWRANTAEYHLLNNIFAEVAETCLTIGTRGSAERSTASNNLFHHSQGPVRMAWNGRNFSASRAMLAVTAQGDASLTGDPGFVDAPSGDFRLRSHGSAVSPAIEAGACIQHYVDLYHRLYGLDLGVDADGLPRPQGQAVDIGAHEAPAQPPGSLNGIR